MDPRGLTFHALDVNRRRFCSASHEHVNKVLMVDYGHTRTHIHVRDQVLNKQCQHILADSVATNDLLAGRDVGTNSARKINFLIIFQYFHSERCTVQALFDVTTTEPKCEVSTPSPINHVCTRCGHLRPFRLCS